MEDARNPYKPWDKNGHFGNSRGYVELLSESGGCFGYDSIRNRWASGERAYP